VGKEKQVTSSSTATAVTPAPSPAADFGDNSASPSTDASARETPTLDALGSFEFGEERQVASAADGTPAASWADDDATFEFGEERQVASAKDGASKAGAPSKKNLDTPFTKTVDGETYTLRWHLEDGEPTLQVQEDGKWDRPTATLLRKLGYDSAVAAEDKGFFEGNLAGAKDTYGDLKGVDHKQRAAFANNNAVAGRDATGLGDSLQRDPTREVKEQARLHQIRTDPEALTDATQAEGQRKLTQQKNALGKAVSIVEKASWEKSFQKEIMGLPIPVFGPLTVTPGMGVSASAKVGMLSNPVDDLDVKPDGLGAKAKLPLEVGAEASLGGEVFARLGHPNVGFDAVIKFTGTIAGKGSAEVELGVGADDGLSIEGKMGIGAEGGVTAALAGRMVVSFGGFREVIDVGELFSVDLLKLTWTPAELAWSLLPDAKMDTSAMMGGMAFDLTLGEMGGGPFGWLTDWANADDEAHEKVQAMQRDGVLDLLDNDAKIELLSSMDDMATFSEHESSMAALYLTQPRGLPFIRFVERYYEKDQGELPDQDERYEDFMDHIDSSVLDDNEDASAEVQAELANSYWVLEPDDVMKPDFKFDDSVPGGHREHWLNKVIRDGRLHEWMGIDGGGGW
jgi:hypothetical protein